MKVLAIIEAAARRLLPAHMFSVPTNWQPIKSAPVGRPVLVRYRDSVGEVYDVAVFVGRQPDGELRWIMSDVHLVSRQLTHWHELPELPGGA